ncbi:hypothetical protein [Schaalia hyovaginalis]|uniref:hypothetical protein n=1 Tax=Schaalia hyovaginalis TaxID=29316 RepID=UPI0012B36B39|nr:hypothetical protein [Schaalia hyovaginalis]MST63227.1 hypothetical protein [Schaalia hyovaginalis]
MLIADTNPAEELSGIGHGKDGTSRKGFESHVGWIPMYLQFAVSAVCSNMQPWPPTRALK